MENNFKINAFTNCIAKRCPGKTSKDIKMFRIPISDFEAWCHNLQLDDRLMRSHWRVCSRHFHSKEMGLKKLKIGVRPTLNLGHDNVIPSIVSTHKKWKPRRCCIFGCTTTCPPSTVFSFPKDPVREQLWIDRCHLKRETKIGAKKYICGNHFDQKMKGSGKLLANAIPNTIVNCTDCKNCRKKRPLTSLDISTCENVQPNTIETFQLVPLPISGENSISVNKEACEDHEDDLQMDTSEESNPSTVENNADPEDNNLLAPLPKNNSPYIAKNCEGNLQLDSLTMSPCESSIPKTVVNCEDYEKCIDNLHSVPLPISGENFVPFNKEPCEEHEDDISRPINIIPNIAGNCEGNTSENPIPYVIENCESYIHDIQLDPLDMNGCKGCRALSGNIKKYKTDILKEKERNDSIEASYARVSMNLQQEIASLRKEVDLWKSRTEEAVLKNMQKSSENPAIAFAYIIDPERKGHCTSFQTNILLKLYEISPPAYRYMSQELSFNLPNETTLYRWRQKSKNMSDLT